MTRTVILGAGFGGLTVATELRSRLGDGHDIVLVDREEHFLVGARKLWALVGLGDLAEGRRRREVLNDQAIRFLRRGVRAIDPAGRRVEMDGETLEGDALVVALGAELRPDLVPGMVEHAHNLYDAEAIPDLAAILQRFDGGRIALVIAGAPYKCPPAPYECAMLLDEHLRRRGLRERTEITVTTLQPILMPNAGLEGSAWLSEQLTSRGIEHHAGRAVQSVGEGHVVYADGTSLEADVILGVPPHRAPTVVAESGLAGEGGWIAVDPATLETGREHVFAVGDVTQIRLGNGLPLPKAGIFAELEGRRVAAAIAAHLRGREAPPPFDGRGYCFIELGSSVATLVEGDFFARPEPQVFVRGVAARHSEDKRRFETERLRRWFGA